MNAPKAFSNTNIFPFNDDDAIVLLIACQTQSNYMNIYNEIGIVNLKPLNLEMGKQFCFEGINK